MCRLAACLILTTTAACTTAGHLSAPGCYIEPSKTPSGVEVIYYPNARVHVVAGVPTTCPTKGR